MLGQLAAIFIVAQGLEFDVPVIPCVAIVGLSALLNLALQIAFNPMQRLEPVYAAALLALNIVELAGLLFFTGGLQNPFSFLFLAPVLISATALPIRLTIALGVLAVACASALVFFHLPLPWDGDDPLVLPPIYLFGVWLSIVLAIGVTSLYAFQVTEEARKLSDALAATELVLTREQHLTQIDGLAAAAAHELGTPLSTIFLISRELEKTVHGDEPSRRRPQDAARAGAALPRHPGQDHPALLHRRAVRPHAAVDADRGSGGAAPRFRRRHQGAASRSQPRASRSAPATRRFSMASATSWKTPSISPATTVEVNAWWNSETVEIVISDDGPGIAPDMLKRIGEPYLSRRRSADEDQSGHPGSGSAFSSPARCWSAPAPRSRSPTGPFPITAPWCRSCGRASASRPTKSSRKQRLRPLQWHFVDVRSTIGGLGSAILPRHML